MENLTQKNKEDIIYKETEVKIEEINLKDEEIKQDDPLKQLILEEITRFSPHSEVLTLSTLMAVNHKKNFNDRYRVHICNISPPGQGKSRNTVELLKLLRIPFSLIAGHTTPRQFFNELSKDGIIIVDEGATILSDKNIINLLLNALWNGRVEWKNNKELLTHNFQGVIIFNVNKLSNTALTEALKDRIFVNEINLSTEQIKEKIVSAKDYTPNMEIWAKIRERLEFDTVSEKLTFKCREKNRKNGLLSPKNLKNEDLNKNYEDFDILFEKIYHLIENGEEEIKSVRELNKLEILAAYSYALVGDLTLIDYFRKTDAVWKILNMPIKRSDKVKRIAEAKCITERQAYRIIEKFENGKKI